jgi:hypothetical protein
LIFAAPPIPGYVYVHGAALSAWFLLIVAQTSFVSIGRTAVHRRLGTAG